MPARSDPHRCRPTLNNLAVLTVLRLTVLGLTVLGLTTGGWIGAPTLAHAQQTATERELAAHSLHGNRRGAMLLAAETARARNSKNPELADKLETLPWSVAEAVELAQWWTTEGKFGAARAVLAPHVGTKTADPRAALALVEVERLSADAPTRLKLLMKLGQSLPKHLPLRLQLGQALYETGKAIEARKLLDPLADLYQEGSVTETQDLVAVARSLALNGYFKDALAVLAKAEDGAEEPADQVAIQLELGQLYLQKYNYRDADSAMRKVLQINPNHPLARTAMARIDVASDGDLAKARERLDAVLRDHPAWLPARALRAEIALHDEDVEQAKAQLGIGSAQRADFPDLVYVQGAIAKIGEDPVMWTQAVQAATRLNPNDGNLYLQTAVYLEMAHRYREVRELLQEALKRDGDLWQAHAALGVAWARVADDAKAKKELELAFGGDPYDVRTANQLTILYDDVLKSMHLLSGPNVDLRVHKKERKVLERTALPFLQSSVDQLTTAYGFAPKKPLLVEIFPQVQQFAVRTVGLPQMGAHAVCFGHLITSRSPVAEPFNWKLVLFHELSHVYHIQASDGRVPRWLTEGLAMMETAWANPRWRQANDRRA